MESSSVSSAYKQTLPIASRALSVFMSLALVATMTLLPSKRAEAAPTTITIPVKYGQTEARNMLSLVNQFRASNAKCWNENNTAQVTYSGLQPLTYDYELEKTAMKRAAELVLMFAHDRPNGDDCFSAYNQQVWAAGENIAYGYRSANSVYMGWREDNDKYAGQGHRRNMLNSEFTSIGIGHAVFDGIDFWVQDFGYPNSGAAATPANNSLTNVDIEVDSSAISSQKLTLAKSSMSVVAGKSASLPAVSKQITFTKSSGLDNLKYTVSGANWTSSNPSVAAVSNGKVVGKAAGTAKLTATVNGSSTTLAVTVSPATPTLKSAKAGKKKSTVKWAKVKGVSGYEIWASTSKKFTAKTTVKKTASKSKTSLVVKKLKSKKKYYVKVRAYVKAAGSKNPVYSNWSKVKNVKVK